MEQKEDENAKRGNILSLFAVEKRARTVLFCFIWFLVSNWKKNDIRELIFNARRIWFITAALSLRLSFFLACLRMNLLLCLFWLLFVREKFVDQLLRVF